MSLRAYDSDRDGIGLGPPGGEKGFTVAGAYRKSFKRDQSADNAGVHYGSDSYFNTPGVSSWSMDDFTGGGWQQVWGKDNRMFSICQNMIPSQFDRSLRTVPPLTLRAATGVGGGIYTTKPRHMYNHQGWITVAYQDRIYRNHASGGAAEIILPTFGGAQYGSFVYDPRTTRLLGSFINGLGPGIAVFDALTGAHIVGASVQPGALVPYGGITGMNVSGDKLVVSCQSVILTVTMQDGALNYISGDYTRVGKIPGGWIDSCWSGGLLYILTGGADRKVSLVAFDGVQVLPVCEFPYNFYGASLCAYGGRIYVGGSGLDFNGALGYAELYEVTGSSVRLLKTFAPEKWAGGKYNYPTSIYSMVVHEGLLFFGNTGYGLYCYDLTTDAFYGGPQLDAGRSNSGREILSLISARGRIWAYVNHPAAPGDNAIWASVVAGDFAPTAANPGSFVSSDFGPELDRQKDWGSIRVLTRGDSNTPTVDSSIDGGANWTSCPLASSATCGQAGVLRTFTINSANSHAIRFRITLPRNASPTVSYAELAGFSASFKLIDSDMSNPDGSEKLAWSFAIAGVEEVELQDGTSEVQRLKEIREALWSWAQNKTVLNLIDTDGTTRSVKIDSISESQPAVMPPVNFNDETAPLDVPGREAFYALVLIEN